MSTLQAPHEWHDHLANRPAFRQPAFTQLELSELNDAVHEVLQRMIQKGQIDQEVECQSLAVL